MVKTPPWSWHDVSAGAGGVAVEEARRLEERQRLEDRGWHRSSRGRGPPLPPGRARWKRREYDPGEKNPSAG